MHWLSRRPVLPGPAEAYRLGRRPRRSGPRDLDGGGGYLRSSVLSLLVKNPAQCGARRPTGDLFTVPTGISSIAGGLGEAEPGAEGKAQHLPGGVARAPGSHHFTSASSARSRAVTCAGPGPRTRLIGQEGVIHHPRPGRPRRRSRVCRRAMAITQSESPPPCSACSLAQSSCSRSNVSAALPGSAVAASDATTLYDVLGSHFVCSTCASHGKLDRLLHAGGRGRPQAGSSVERHEARARLATRTLDALFALKRAQVDAADAVPGSREAIEAELRGARSRATLEVLTGGWFSAASSP